MNNLAPTLLLFSLISCCINTAFSESNQESDSNVISAQETLRNAIDNNDAAMIYEILMDAKEAHSACIIEDCEEGECTSPINRGSLLRRAARKGHAECINALIDFGAPVDERGPTQDTAAYWAVKKGHVDALESLLKEHANPNQTCALGNTLLYWADKKLCEAIEMFKATEDPKSMKDIETFEAIASLLLEYGAKEDAHSDEPFAPSIGGFGNSPSQLFGTPVFKVYP